jgi:hypothetical protein
MKPNPFMALYHSTVPDSSTEARSAGGYIGRSGRARLGGSCCAVLLSTLRISLTCGPFGPRLARTSSVAPGATLPRPLRSTTLTCRKASPDSLASCTKPNPLSGLYHLTTAWTGGSGCLKPLGARSRYRSETAPGCFEVVVVEATATGRTKISVSAAHVILWRRMECSPIWDEEG